jgi:glycosyltransferase involved in cell wall biosynthesis
MKKLLIYVPTFNRLESLKICVGRLLVEAKGLEAEIEIHISDNNSTDGTNEYLQEIDNEIISVSKNKENIGGPLNILKVHDLSHICEYTLIIGDDDYIVGGALKKLIAYLYGNSKIDFFFINTLSYEKINQNKILDILEKNEWKYLPDGGNRKSRINDDFYCTMEELIDPKIDEVLGGSVMCYVFRSSSVTNHLEDLNRKYPFEMFSSNIYSSYPHTLNWIYSFKPQTPSAFISMPITINFWHEGKEWGDFGYHHVVGYGLGFLLFELMRLNYIKEENREAYLNHYISLSKKSLLLILNNDSKKEMNNHSKIFLNLLLVNILTMKY